MVKKTTDNKIDLTYATNGEIEILGRKNAVEKTRKNFNTELDAKKKRIAEYKKEANRKVSLANKRVKRLEHNDLKDTPAYKAYIETGGKFSVKGKTFNELQAEVSRLDNFINAKTSTVRGANQVLKDTANITGMKYKDLKDLKANQNKFFEVASKVEEYLRVTQDMASAIGYQKIWEQINMVVEKNRVELASANADIDNLISEVTKSITESEKRSIFRVSEGAIANKTWFTLDE